MACPRARKIAVTTCVVLVHITAIGIYFAIDHINWNANNSVTQNPETQNTVKVGLKEGDGSLIESVRPMQGQDNLNGTTSTEAERIFNNNQAIAKLSTGKSKFKGLSS